jgi:hypothetical protein
LHVELVALIRVVWGNPQLDSGVRVIALEPLELSPDDFAFRSERAARERHARARFRFGAGDGTACHEGGSKPPAEPKP